MKSNWMFTLAIGTVLTVGGIVGVTAASGQKAAGSGAGGKQCLAAVDVDHDGTVSKQEFTTYMRAQFDVADADHDGTLDTNELEQLRKSLAIATK